VRSILKLKQIGLVSRSALITAFLLFCFYILFRDCFAAVGLYVNKLANRGVVTRSYIPEYLNNDKTSELNLSLFELRSIELIKEKDLIRSAYHLRVGQRDMVHIDLKEDYQVLPVLIVS